MRRVARISISPVKGFRLQHPHEVHLSPDGVVGNRSFFLVDVDGQRLRSSLVHSTSGTLDVTGCIVEGPWEEPLSRLAGSPVRLARADRTGAGMNAPVTLVSDGSLARLAHEAGRDAIDSRRFRMLFELDGCEAHEEDSWEGRCFEIGSAVVRVGGPVDRCAVTTRDPETGERDLDPLRLLKDYRCRRASEGAVLFGVYAFVEQPGVVRVGDSFATSSP